MYALPAHRIDDRAALIATAREIGFACVVTPSPAGMLATHVPVTVRDDAIEFHVTRANPHWRAAAEEDGADGETLVVFQGPHAYVHPGWYPTKQETGKVVPTSLYVAVHVRGPLTRMTDRETQEQIEALTDESEQGRERPWAVSDAPADYLAKMTRAIVGLRVPIRSIEGVRKLNQHKGEADRRGVRDGLMAEGSERWSADAR